MISPFTPAGAKIVCIDDDEPSCIVPGLSYDVRGLDGLKCGAVYTLEKIVTSKWGRSGLSAVVREIRRPWHPLCAGGFDISRFELAALPRCLTEILERAPAPKLKERALP